MLRALPVVLLALAGSLPARAEFVPLVPDDIPRLVSRRARLHVTRPTDTRGRGEPIRLYPGDLVVAAAPHLLSGDTPSPVYLEVKIGEVTKVMHLEDLSQRPIDYSYRGKQSFDEHVAGLAADAVRLMDLYQRTAARWGYRVPGQDPRTRKLVSDWYRVQHLRRQFQFLRMRFFDLGYHRGDERRLLEREKDWLPARGEEFITQYAGQLTPEKKKRIQEIYLTMNSLDHVPSICAQVAELEEQIARPPDDSKYQNLEPAHRARLRAEDVAALHTRVTELKSKLVVTLSQGRARLLAQQVKLH